MRLRQAFWHRRECLVPTWRGWVVLLLTSALVMAGLVLSVHPFLAVHDPKPGGLLVVEGWASEVSMMAVKEEWERDRYAGIFVTGASIEKSSPLAPYKSFAEYGALVLTRLGCDPQIVHAVPVPWVARDRTYSSAVMLRDWLKEHELPAKRINLYSTGVHSRRSRLLFQKAFGDDTEIGIVATKGGDYDPRRWWRTSGGFRNVTDEVIAYLYARFLFRPAAE